jgi:short-subunit dehydrogenase
VASAPPPLGHSQTVAPTCCSLVVEKKKLAEVARLARNQGVVAEPLVADLASRKAITALAKNVVTMHGVPDVLVNNAGAGHWRYYDETSAEEAAELMAVPYLAAFGLCRELVPKMVARGSGHVVNVTSAAAFMAWPGATGYVAARYAMRGFHEALSADLAKGPVRTTLVAFAKVKSDYWHNNPGSEERVPKAQSMIRELSSQEAATAIVRGVLRRKRAVIEPFSLRFVLWMTRLFPSYTRRLMVESGYRRKLPAPATTSQS